ncbi:MAG: hypothetical protein GYA63_08240 [Armatimonadetes bacterium]|nr:hypothetical protein [Armatimonadota bacterium]
MVKRLALFWNLPRGRRSAFSTNRLAEIAPRQWNLDSLSSSSCGYDEHGNAWIGKEHVKVARKPSNNTTHANRGFEAQLWAAADALRNNMDAAISANLKELGFPEKEVS